MWCWTSGYRFVVPTGGVFNVALNNILSNGDLHVRVFFLNSNSTLSEVANSTAVGGFTSQGTSVGVAAGQTLFVWVFGFNFAEGFYDLTMNVS